MPSTERTHRRFDVADEWIMPAPLLCDNEWELYVTLICNNEWEMPALASEKVGREKPSETAAPFWAQLFHRDENQFCPYSLQKSVLQCLQYRSIFPLS